MWVQSVGPMPMVQLLEAAPLAPSVAPGRWPMVANGMVRAHGIVSTVLRGQEGNHATMTKCKASKVLLYIQHCKPMSCVLTPISPPEPLLL